MAHKAGFVNIIGSPNVGKSTLMNAMVGERISIITSKAQTTRHRIMGIVNGEYLPAGASMKAAFQIVYSDTPGIIKPAYKLQEGMMRFMKTALYDGDVILLVTDVFEREFKEESILEKIQKTNVPVLLLLNKIDLSEQEKVEERLKHWQALIPAAEVIPISALKIFNIEKVFDRILELIPESPPYYPKDELTDKPERFFASEIIREKIFLNYDQEIPYSCEVLIESFKEDHKIIRIRAEIIVARDSQKGILIGHKGSKLKKVGTEARKDMEDFLQKKVFLELFVKVNKDWRNKELQLKRYGYFN